MVESLLCSRGWFYHHEAEGSKLTPCPRVLLDIENMLRDSQPLKC